MQATKVFGQSSKGVNIVAGEECFLLY